VRVGHRQALILKIPSHFVIGDFFCLQESGGHKVTGDF